MATEPMIEIEGLSRRFGPILAVDDVSLTIRSGEVLGFLGPNGAGKSTTMKMITGFLAPTAGRVRIAGNDIAGAAIEAKRRIGYLPEGAPAYPDMTPRGFLDFIANIRGLSGVRRRERLDFAIDAANLGGVLDQLIDTLSKGFKRRVGLAQAILHDPDILIMDEPTDGLDPNQKHEVRGLIESMASDKCIVISTHILEEVEAICTRAVIMAQGRLLADGAPRELQARSRFRNAVSVRVAAEQETPLREILDGLDGVEAVDKTSHATDAITLTAFPRDGAQIIGSLIAALDGAQVAVRGIHVEPGRLDEVFRTITTGGAEKAA